MQKWEYRDVRYQGHSRGWEIDGEQVDRDGFLGLPSLNRLGEEGWELVATAHSGGGTCQYVFKRPKQ
jgi:hypothetical protein